ncbi:MAG: 4-hydroxythreonine-4-phosphate dehydrogenase PdxA [Mariprofundales bacterium]|nr:4-hydroxythreonine-4-phosphate dehydrogenase PdxA [Mariprofundales bacterium]
MSRRLLLTLGEPAGIGPDSVLLLWREQPHLFDSLVVVAPISWLLQRARQLHVEVPLLSVQTLDEAGVGGDGIYCYQPASVADEAAVVAGTPSLATADAVVASIAWAAQACLHGEAQAMVTGPIEKSVLRDGGFTFPGHTEFLAHLCGQREVVMMLATTQFRVALLTTHLALREVPERLTVAGCVEVATILYHDLRLRFAIDNPKIALCALNPHAGERGHFGDEELRVLMPAAQQLRAAGVDTTDPMAADTLFVPQISSRFDAIICCYHDQALIPLKMAGFGSAVNISLGLPLIRTSVDHGTALDRAGGGEIECGSLACAITTAWQMVAATERGCGVVSGSDGGCGVD